MGEHFEESLKLDPFSVELIGNIAQRLIYVLVTLVVPQCFCSGDYLPDIGLSSVVGVEVEQSIEIFDLFEIEGRIGGDYRFSEDLLFFFLNQLFLVYRFHGYYLECMLI